MRKAASRSSLMQKSISMIFGKNPADMKTLIFLIFWTSFEVLGQGEFSGKVISVIDGNTVDVVVSDTETIRVVLTGIDSPEIGQKYGEEAKAALKKILLKKDVKVKLVGKDRWGNNLAVVMKGSSDPRIELLEKGLAWTAERNPEAELEKVRLTAQASGLGIWEDENPTPPWTFRRQQTMMQAKGH